MKLPPPYRAPSDDSDESEEECAFTNSEFLFIVWDRCITLSYTLMIVVNYQIQWCGFLENVYEHILLKKKIQIS